MSVKRVGLPGVAGFILGAALLAGAVLAFASSVGHFRLPVTPVVPGEAENRRMVSDLLRSYRQADEASRSLGRPVDDAALPARMDGKESR